MKEDTIATRLIQPSDRFFVAGARGMAGSAIVRALQRSGYGNPAQGGELLTPSRQELNLLNDQAVTHWMTEGSPMWLLAAATVGGIGQPQPSGRFPARNRGSKPM